MCGGLEFLKRAKDLPLPELLAAVQGSGAGLEAVRVFFPNPKAALLVSPERDLWLPWGRRKEQPGDWPEGGWARRESLDKAYWTRWDPEEVPLRPARWMEKDRRRVSLWFDLEPGTCLRGLVLRGAPGTPVYVVTEAASGDFRDQVHDRIPVITPDPGERS